MITLQVRDETAPLEVVVLGTSASFGGVPDVKDAYDPKSIMHIQAGTYPKESDIHRELAAVEEVFHAYDVEVFRPRTIANLNQVFSRDIGIVIGDRFIVPHILENRASEVDGIDFIIDQIDPAHVIRVTGEARIEGGDIMPHRDRIFAGYSRKADFDKYVVARTNEAGIDFLEANFSDCSVHAFELNKSDTDPYENALHLDCCFQPVGKDMAILYPGGFKNQEDVAFLREYFGSSNVIEITKEEMYQMCSNVVSISPDVVISDTFFTRLNSELRSRGLTVEEVSYREIAKMEGLLRCSTMPIRRSYV